MELPTELRRFSPDAVWDMLANHHRITGTGDLTNAQWEIFGAMRGRYLAIVTDPGEPITTFSTTLTGEGRTLLDELSRTLRKG